MTLSAEGTPETLTTDLSANDPRLTESDIVSLLLTGRTTAELGGARADLAREQAFELGGGQLFGVAGQALGLDAVKVERGSGTEAVHFDPSLVATETNPGARLTFSKQLPRGVQVIFSQSLRESGSSTWIVSYTPLPNVQIRGIVRDDTDRSLEFRHSLSFGGSSAAFAADGATSEPSGRIAAVQFTGQLDAPEAELRNRLTLKTNDRFDFYQWQDDRDRLQQYYSERGFRETQVRTRRLKGTGPEVTLEYRIEPGPLTALDIQGYELPLDVHRDLEAAWTRAVVDEFLLEDIVSRIRLYLLGEGYLRSTVTADVRSPSPDLKEIGVQIDPGPRSSERQTNFVGNSTLSTEELHAIVQRLDLEGAAWLDPRRLERAITARYGFEGLLGATMTVRPAEYNDDTAILPMVIEEGAVFRVAELRFAGVDALQASAVREAAGLTVGDLFSETRLEDARFRIERDYRQVGFNTVEVSSERTIDREAASVSIGITVREEPRQVLRDVRISGAGRTHSSVIARALQLRVGDPVNLGEWYQARKRLYDTGVFRSVEITPEPMGARDSSGEESMRAQVELRVWPPVQLRYGFQVNDEIAPAVDASRRFSLGVGGDLTYQNLFGRAATAGISGRYSQRFLAARAFATMPTVFGLSVLSNVFLSRSREKFGEGRRQSVRGRQGGLDVRAALPAGG